MGSLGLGLWPREKYSWLISADLLEEANWLRSCWGRWFCWCYNWHYQNHPDDARISHGLSIFTWISMGVCPWAIIKRVPIWSRTDKVHWLTSSRGWWRHTIRESWLPAEASWPYLILDAREEDRIEINFLTL